MGQHPWRFAALAVVVIAAVVAGCGGSDSGNGGQGGRAGLTDTSNCPPDATEKIEGDTIKIGSAAPLSGQYAVLAVAGRAAGAYFDLLNSRGGVKTVDGPKKIEFLLADNKYSPSETQSEVRRLVQQEQVAAIGSLLGTAPNVAVAPYLNQVCVPALWSISGGQESIGPKFPFNTQYDSFLVQGAAIGKAIAKAAPDAKVALLYPNDDIGASIQRGVDRGIQGTSVKIVEEQSYEATDPDVRAQMTTLAASDADVWVNAAVADKCTQSFDDMADSDWRPKTVYLGESCQAPQIAAAKLVEGVDLIQARLFKPLGIDDPAIEEFESTMRDANIDSNSNSFVGWATAQLVAETLKRADELTPVGLAEAARKLTSLPPSFRDGLEPAVGEPVPTNDFQMASWDPKLEEFGPGGPIIRGTPGK